MKKSIFTIVISIAMVFTAKAQQMRDNVAKECVLFEVFTGVRCPYCPAAANGIAQLLQEGKAIAPVAYHTSAFSTEEYYTNETNARANYYSISSYPTLKVDGKLHHAGGGNASASNYAAYLNLYNQRINIPSAFTIDLSYTPLEGRTCQVTAVVNKVGDNSSNNLRVMIALTESHINVSWQGMSELNCVTRDMIPTQNGTVFSGNSITVTETFEMNYPKNNCNLVAWVQDYSTKEVFQAVILPTNIDAPYDLVLQSVEEYTADICSGRIAPSVKIENQGNETVTSFDVVTYAGTEEINRYAWSGNLAAEETIKVNVPEYEIGNNGNLTIVIENPNNNEDAFAADNQQDIQINEAGTINGYLKLQMKTGSKPEDILVELIDKQTGEVIKTVTYDRPSAVQVDEFEVLSESCVALHVKDLNGNGLSGGFFAIYNANNNILYKGGGNFQQFENILSYEFHTDGTLNVTDNNIDKITICPNPTQGLVTIHTGMTDYNVRVYNVMGQCVLNMNSCNDGMIDLTTLGKGLFYLEADNGINKTAEKLIIK